MYIKKEKYNNPFFMEKKANKAGANKALYGNTFFASLVMIFLFMLSACAGEDKQSALAFEDAIAEHLYSQFTSGKTYEGSNKEAELIADTVVETIINGQYDDFVFNSKLGFYVEAIVEGLYDDDWQSTDDDAMNVATKVLENLRDRQQVNEPLILDLTTRGAYNLSFSIKTYDITETFYRMHYRLDCGNGDEVVEASYLLLNKPANNVEHTCTYQTPGSYQISITQQRTILPLGLPQLQITAGGEHLDGVRQWGSGYWLSMLEMFDGVTSDFTFPDEAPLTAQLQDMSYMFYSATNFNQSLENWDVSSVMNMISMFYAASHFNQRLNSWDVSSVTDMSEMFSNASNFNQPLNEWNVRSVTKMEYMFFGASNFNQPLNNWDVSNVADMRFMFKYALVFNQSLNEWGSIKQASLFTTDMLDGADAFSDSNCTWCP